MKPSSRFPHFRRLASLALGFAAPVLVSAAEPEETSNTLRAAASAPVTPPDATVLDTLVVSAALERTLFEQAQAVSVLKGQALQLAMEPTLGQTLARTPGVSSSYFGPVASRPVIRGLDGDRVRILQNGLNSLDASGTSVDHAVSFDVGNLEAIEVVRGPATLMYGSNAIGGVVNAIDNRIPDERITGLHGSLSSNFTSVDNGYSTGLMLEGGDGPFAFHFEAFTRASEDLAIPGDARSSRLQAIDPLPAGTPEPTGRLPGSNLRAEGIRGGGSYIWEGGFIGFSLGTYHSNYASPAEEGISIDMQQTRLDVKGAFYKPFGWVKELNYRFAYTDYEHTEFEITEPGTVFKNEGYDARVELKHEKLGPFEGAFGIQSDRSDFAALGDEAFLPPVLTLSNSAFFFEEVPVGPVRVQFGARYDHISVESSESPPNFGPGQKRTFDNFSASAGMVYNPTEEYALAFSVAYSERAPTYQELFAGGAHLATGVFEVGDPNLGVEKSIGIDLSLRRRTGRVTGSVGVFYNRFDNFITAFPTGATDPGSGFPIVNFRGTEAEFYGAELETTFHLLNAVTDTPPPEMQTDVNLEFKADYTHARDTATGTPLPRIPPFHLSSAIIFQRGPLSARLEGVYAARQNDVSTNELPTDSYFLVNAAITYSLVRGPVSMDLYLKGVNLTDAEAREHTSFLKDRAPLGGRGLVVGMKTTF